MKCFYCGKSAVGMKATGYFNTSATVFRFLCKKHWHKVYANYDDEKEDTYDKK